MTYKRRFLPVEPYEVDALESWLSDCSAEGLFLEELNTIFATFIEKEPHRLHYRLIPKKDSDSYTSEQQGAVSYEEHGWKFVASLGRYFFIYTAEEGTTEISIDPIEESKQYTRFAGKEETPAKKFVLYAISAAMIVFYIWWELKQFFEKTPYDLVQRIDFPFEILPAVLFGAFFTTGRARGFRRLQKQLATGESRTHEADWQDFSKTHRHKLYYISQIFYIALFFLPLLPFTFGYSDKPLAEVKEPLPLIRLADLENDPQFYALDTYIQKDKREREYWWEREANLVSSRFTIGAPVQFSYNQAGMVTDRTDAYDDPYQPVLWIKYYEFSPFVTAKEYVDSYLELVWNKDRKNTILTDSPFDYAVLSEEEDNATLFLVYEDALLELSYSYGDADLTEHYDLYLEALKEYHQT